MRITNRRISEEYAEQQSKLLGNDFYASKVWKTVRLRALQIYGAECHCCSDKGTRQEPLHVDHIKPRSLYPRLSLDITNLQILCKRCNEKKSNLHETDYRLDHHKKFADDYVNNNKSLQKIILERTTGIPTKALDDKQFVKNKKPNNITQISKRERIKRKNTARKQTKIQVSFLREARKAQADGKFFEFVEAFTTQHGEEMVGQLIKRCNLSHWKVR